MDWLTELIVGNMRICRGGKTYNLAATLTTAIRIEIKKRRPTDKKGDWLDAVWFNQALADYDKALGLEESQ